MKWLLVTVLLIIGAVWCQDDIMNNLQDIQNNPDIQNKTEDVEKSIREKCIRVGGEKAFDNLKAAKEEIVPCISALIDTETIKGEIEVAKKNGSMDEVFGKYCKKRPELLQCINSFTGTVKECLMENEQETLRIVKNLTETLVEFACYKDGDRIAMFIAEGGQNCLTKKEEGIKECFNKSMKNIIPNGELSFENLPLFVIDEKDCAEYDVLRKCVVHELESCTEKTPANLVESLFKYIRKVLPCDAKKEGVQVADGGHFLNDVRSKREDNPSQLQQENENLGRSIFDRFKPKCDKNFNAGGAYERLNISFTNFLSCGRVNLFNRSSSECPIIKGDIEICMEYFLRDLKLCLTPNEDFFPKLLRESIESGLTYVCEANGRRLEDFKRTHGLQCLLSSPLERLSQCLLPINNKPFENDQVILKKDLICKDMNHIKDCLEMHLTTYCGSERSFNNIIIGTIQAMNGPCSTNNQANLRRNSEASSKLISNILVLGLMFFHIQKLSI